jgi:putative acetyltransferase
MTAPDIRFRTATNADGATIMALIEAVFAEYEMIWNAATEVPDLFALEERYSGDKGTFFVAELGGQVVGTVGITLEGDQKAEVHRLYVSPHHRRLGLGRSLMQQALTWAHERDIIEMIAWSDTRFGKAHQLYRSLGFTQLDGQREMVGDINNSYEYQFVMQMLSR